jgi:nucleotide-binding universal stress UspA family protein
MAYKDILVHIDDSKSSAARLETAIKLAGSYDAQLTGLYVIPDYETVFLAAGYTGPELLEVAREAVQKQVQQQEAAFQEALAKQGLRSAEWRCVQGEPVRQFIWHAGYHDLAIIGQADPQDSASLPGWSVGQVLLGTGRPVLVIPYIGAGQTIGGHVLIAWNASREAVRVVNDALPFLSKAHTVSVVTIHPPAGASLEETLASAALCQHLARHGITATSMALPASDLEVGDVLLSRAADESIDLIVMGAYGHSRLREIVLGGTTRHLLHHMTVPVLMSH